MRGVMLIGVLTAGFGCVNRAAFAQSARTGRGAQPSPSARGQGPGIE
jgi:hypothetical protein